MVDRDPFTLGKYKNKGCREFFLNKTCLYGSRCSHKHELRKFEKINRHYYTPRLYVLESLYETTTLSKEEFLSQHDPKTSILPVFANIHSESDNEQEASTSEEELSMIER